MKCFAKFTLIVSLLGFTACSPKENGVTWGSSFTWRELFNIHESPRSWLSVLGDRYHHLRGRQPYHLNIPDIHGIFFVTEDRPGTDFKCHFYLLEERRDVVFQMRSGFIGGGIGEPKEAIFSDWIGSVNWPVVVVMHKAEAKTTAFYFNLRDGTVTEGRPETEPTRQP